MQCTYICILQLICLKTIGSILTFSKIVLIDISEIQKSLYSKQFESHSNVYQLPMTISHPPQQDCTSRHPVELNSSKSLGTQVQNSDLLPAIFYICYIFQGEVRIYSQYNIKLLNVLQFLRFLLFFFMIASLHSIIMVCKHCKLVQ